MLTAYTIINIALFLDIQKASSAKYIVQQYIASIGGVGAMDSLKSMCAVGQVRISGSEMRQSGESIKQVGGTEVGGFLLWQKNPDLWHFELVVSGLKVSSGSDGKVAWNQSSSQPSRAHRGPPRPLRRFFQVQHKSIITPHFYRKPWFDNSKNCILTLVMSFEINIYNMRFEHVS